MANWVLGIQGFHSHKAPAILNTISRQTVYNIHVLGNLKNSLMRRVSTPHSIAASIRSGIIDGGLLSESPLKQEELAKFFGVSRIPVREALRQLESEGWITFCNNKGASVRALTIEEAREIYEILAALECTALKLALHHHTPESLLQIQHFLDRTKAHRGSGREIVNNLKFHLTLYAPAKREKLLRMIQDLRQRGNRYLRLKLSVGDEWKKSEAEHRAILNACVAGNHRRALSLLDSHLLGTGKMLVRYFESETDRRKTDPSESLAALQREAAAVQTGQALSVQRS
jgi:DNA-binding GntR family transcriptional regulator